MFREWKYGVHRLSKGEINRLGFPKGVLLEVAPAEASLDSMVGMQRVLYMLQNYPGRFSFEIWRDQKFGFHFFSSSESVEGMLRGQLAAIYPQASVKRAKLSVPRLKEGEYVSSCFLTLRGVELNLKCPEDFQYDPLRHVLEAMNCHDSRIVVQVLFERLRKISKEKRITLAQKYGDDLFFRDVGIPVLKCLVRVVAVSEDGYRARESCWHVARVFSVFDSDRCRLVPRFLSFPLLRNSFGVLSSVSRREFPLFSTSFMVSVPELASMVHLPVGAESCGVEYVNPSLTPW